MKKKSLGIKIRKQWNENIELISNMENQIQ